MQILHGNLKVKSLRLFGLSTRFLLQGFSLLAKDRESPDEYTPFEKENVFIKKMIWIKKMWKFVVSINTHQPEFFVLSAIKLFLVSDFLISLFYLLALDSDTLDEESLYLETLLSYDLIWSLIPSFGYGEGELGDRLFLTLSLVLSRIFSTELIASEWKTSIRQSIS